MAITAGDEIKASEIQGALDAKVNNTGNETVAGVKTFSSILVLPASDPTTDNQAVRKAYADPIKLLRYYTTASDNLKLSADTERTPDGTPLSYAKQKEILCVYPGVIRVKFDIDAGTTGNAFGRIYVNAVAIGTERVNGGAYATYSEDIRINEGDRVQFYGHGGGSGTYKVRNFRIYFDRTSVASDGSVITD